MKQSKLRSKYFWVGISGVIVTLAMQLGFIDVGQSDAINNVISTVASALGVFGVWNDAGNATEW